MKRERKKRTDTNKHKHKRDCDTKKAISSHRNLITSSLTLKFAWIYFMAKLFFSFIATIYAWVIKLSCQRLQIAISVKFNWNNEQLMMMMTQANSFELSKYLRCLAFVRPFKWLTFAFIYVFNFSFHFGTFALILVVRKLVRGKEFFFS